LAVPESYSAAEKHVNHSSPVKQTLFEAGRREPAFAFRPLFNCSERLPDTSR
jgi:hypothetical protein